MKYFRSSLITLVFTCFLAQLFGQGFAIPMEDFSRKKPAYIYMEDGSKVTAILAGFKRKKGLIKEVKIKDEAGEKTSVDPSKIQYMYLAPSSIAKLGAKMEKLTNMNKWESGTTMDTTLMNEGYVYFEKVPTDVKGNTLDLMLQLMNAGFSSKLKVYHDPFAKETMSVGVAGIDVAGGLDKSYYIKKMSDDAAYRLPKKDYNKKFKALFGDNHDFMKKYSSNSKWNEFDTHVYYYTNM